MDSETRDILDGNADLGPDGYETAASAELGQLVAQSVARTGPLDPDAVAFDSLLNIDYDDCVIGACTPSLHVKPKGTRPEMTFWDVRNLIAEAGEHGVPLKVTAHTCTLIDRALQAARTHSERTGHAMRVSYTYETLPGPIGSTEVVIVDDVLDTNARPVNAGWRFVPPAPTADVQAAIDQGVKMGLVEVVPSTIAADVGNIRARTIREFRQRGEHEIVPSWTSDTYASLNREITKNHPDSDASVLRVLAARIALAEHNADPLLTLTDMAHALLSITVAVAALGGRELSDDDEPEAFKLYRETIDHLRNAAAGVGEMAGWI
jgi:hypothetical protein